MGGFLLKKANSKSFIITNKELFPNVSFEKIFFRNHVVKKLLGRLFGVAFKLSFCLRSGFSSV